MITLQTLENIPTEKLLEVFNLSFSDYVVPFFLTKEQLVDKLKSDSINLEFSVGAFEENQLIAFILHGYDFVDNLKMVYNAGTGVLPTKRGNQLTRKLYEYVLPILNKKGIDKVVLEVIATNEPAIQTYKKIGFTKSRELNCFKGTLNIANAHSDFKIRKMETYEWQKFHSFWDIKPSWQNSITALENIKNTTIPIGIYENEKLVGYTIFNPKLKRIHQLSVDKEYRRKEVGRQLLKYISKNYEKDITIINVDTTSEATSEFMKDIGLKIYVMQYEMELALK